MTYEAWEAAVPESIKRDPLWKMAVYRKALFPGRHCVAGRDSAGWRQTNHQPRGPTVPGSRINRRKYRRRLFQEQSKRPGAFLEYSLGSARESRGWYWKARHVLEAKVTDHRMELLSELIRLLLAMIRRPTSQEFG